MGRQNITLGEEAQVFLDTLVDIFGSSRSNIVEDLIIEYADNYAQSRREELDAWIEAQEEEEEEEEEEFE